MINDISGCAMGGVTGRPKTMYPPYEFAGTPGPLDESSRKHNVPAVMHTCHFALT